MDTAPQEPESMIEKSSTSQAWYGVYPALVTDVRDPEKLGRVKVRLPWSLDPQGEHYEAWARLATLMAGDRRGSWFIPDVDDEVLVAFEGGDLRQPYVIGALWNGRDDPPASMDAAGRNNRKLLRSRTGLQITLDDRPRQPQLELKTPAGQRLLLKDGPGEVHIEDSNGNKIVLKTSGVEIHSSGSVKVNASYVDVSAAMVAVNAGLVRFSGVVECDTLITNSVISSSYTPGAGNIW